MKTRLQYLLEKLAEEACEVSQIALKTSSFGLDEKHPELGVSNKHLLWGELDDLMCLVGMLNVEFDLGYDASAAAMGLKEHKVNHYHRKSAALGLVEPFVKVEQ